MRHLSYLNSPFFEVVECRSLCPVLFNTAPREVRAIFFELITTGKCNLYQHYVKHRCSLSFYINFTVVFEKMDLIFVQENKSIIHLAKDKNIDSYLSILTDPNCTEINTYVGIRGLFPPFPPKI